MSTWTLEKELCTHAGVDDFTQALQKLGILKGGEGSYALRRDTDWFRGGAETFIFRFWIDSGSQGETGYILKACVAMSFGGSISEVVNSWISRRELLEANGVGSPRLLSHVDGVLIEELIPFELRSTVLVDGANRASLLRSIAHYAGVVSRLGFDPVNLLSDLRSRGTDVVAIDFGEDLGPPGKANQPNAKCFQMMMTELKSWRLRLDEEILDDIRRLYSESSGIERQKLA